MTVGSSRRCRDLLVWANGRFSMILWILSLEWQFSSKKMNAWGFHWFHKLARVQLIARASQIWTGNDKSTGEKKTTRGKKFVGEYRLNQWKNGLSWECFTCCEWWETKNHDEQILGGRSLIHSKTGCWLIWKTMLQMKKPDGETERRKLTMTLDEVANVDVDSEFGIWSQFVAEELSESSTCLSGLSMTMPEWWLQWKFEQNSFAVAKRWLLQQSTIFHKHPKLTFCVDCFHEWQTDQK